MKKVGLLLVVLAVMMLAVSPVFAGGEKEKEQLTVGVVIPYEIGWFTAFHNGFEMVADKENVKLVFGYHEYNADKENQAVQNLIAQGVDALNVTAVTPSSAEYSCRLANEAGIPIQVTESGLAEGEGTPFANIDFNWFEVYEIVAQGLNKDVPGQKNVLMLTGFAGTPPVMEGINGFMASIDKMSDIKMATDPQDSQYATEPALNITKTMVQGGMDFNTAIGGCQEITDGIIQGLLEENVPLDDVTIVSVNGGPMDVQNFKDGELDYCLSQSPALHGMICAQNLINYMRDGNWKERTFSPVVWVSSDNWEEKLIPWDVDESWFPVVDEFVKSGNYKPQLRK
jgi:ABC-type sugar transport system substrate-binding protein